MDQDLWSLHQSKIAEGYDLLKILQTFKVLGISKLEKKIRQEIKFMEKLQSPGHGKQLKKEHLQCSNLQHLAAVVHCLTASQDPTAILQPFTLQSSAGETLKRVIVDVVAEHGHKWYKVVARNPKALDLLSMGAGEFGQKSILDQAEEYLQSSQQHQYLYRIPQVVFMFALGVSTHLSQKLESWGVKVEGMRVTADTQLTPQDLELDATCLTTSRQRSIENVREEREKESGTDVTMRLWEACANVDTGEAADCGEESDSVPGPVVQVGCAYGTGQNRGSVVTKLNLDITAMIAYVSALTNGRCHFRFKEPILNEQARWERERPVKPVLDRLFKGKTLYCCESAAQAFKTIVNTLAGPGEVVQAAELMNQITVVPDQFSFQAQRLVVSGKVKARSRVIFGTGESIQAITVTANSGFIRAAKGQGVEFAVYLHESRALTEAKEKNAEVLVED